MKLKKETEEWVTFTTDQDEENLREPYYTDISKHISYLAPRYIHNHTQKEREYKNGLLVKEYKYNSLSNENNPDHIIPIEVKRTLNYDDQFRIINETESLKSDDGNFEKLDKFTIDYKYNQESYIKTKIKKYSGYLPFIVEGENIIHPDDRYGETDEIESILEVRIVDSKKLWEKFTSISKGKFQETKYHYDSEIHSSDYGDLLKITGPHKIEKYDCVLSIYGHNNSSRHYLDLDTICLEIRYVNNSLERLELVDDYKYRKTKDYKKSIYRNGLLAEINSIYSNYKFLDKEETVGFVIKELFEYDSLNNLITHNYYSLINGELFLYKQKLFEYGEFSSKYLNKDSKQVIEKMILPIKIITKFHKSRRYKEPVSGDRTGYYFYCETLNSDYFSDDFVITNSIFKTYNHDNMIIMQKEIEFGKLKSVEYLSYENRVNCCIKEIFRYDDKKVDSSDVNIFDFDEFNNLTSHIELHILGNTILSKTTKRFYFED